MFSYDRGNTNDLRLLKILSFYSYLIFKIKLCYHKTRVYSDKITTIMKTLWYLRKSERIYAHCMK